MLTRRGILIGNTSLLWRRPFAQSYSSAALPDVSGSSPRPYIPGSRGTTARGQVTRCSVLVEVSVHAVVIGSAGIVAIARVIVRNGKGWCSKGSSGDWFVSTTWVG